MPGRETKALVLAWLLDEPDHHQVVLPAVIARITTATDVLRLAAVRSGGDVGLLTPTRFTALSRPLRRALLQALDGLDVTLVAEDMRRHARAWKYLAERLHPFEYASRYPHAALAFGALRGITLTDDTLSRRLRATARTVPVASTKGPKVALALWSAQVETALAEGDVKSALPLLTRRPGEFLRRLDHEPLTTPGICVPPSRAPALPPAGQVTARLVCRGARRSRTAAW